MNMLKIQIWIWCHGDDSLFYLVTNHKNIGIELLIYLEFLN